MSEADAPMHTPGPWKAANRWGNFGDHNRSEIDAPVGQASRFSYAIKDSRGFCVAHCTGPLVTMSAEKSEANATLAAASPEMLTALHAVLKDGAALSGPTLAAVHRAIAKATWPGAEG